MIGQIFSRALIIMKLDMEIASSSWNVTYQHSLGSDSSSDYSGRNGDSPPATALLQGCDGLNYTDNRDFTLLPAQGSVRHYTTQLLKDTHSYIQPAEMVEHQGYISLPLELDRMEVRYRHQNEDYRSLDSRKHKQLQRRYSSPPVNHWRGYEDYQQTNGRTPASGVKHHSSMRNLNGTPGGMNREFSQSVNGIDRGSYQNGQGWKPFESEFKGRKETANDLIYSPPKGRGGSNGQQVYNSHENGHVKDVEDERYDPYDLSQTYPRSSFKRHEIQNGEIDTNSTVRRRLMSRAKSMDHTKFVRTPSPIPENDELNFISNGFTKMKENRDCDLTKTALHSQYNTLKHRKHVQSEPKHKKIQRSKSLNSVGDSDSDNDDYGFLPLYGDVDVKLTINDHVDSADMQKSSKSPAAGRRILPKKWRKPKALPQKASGHGWTSEVSY